MTIRLTGVAIKRDDQIHLSNYQYHDHLRKELGDEDCYHEPPGDESGFCTSEGNFLTRHEAIPIGLASGQLSPHWNEAGRDLLSSDIIW